MTTTLKIERFQSLNPNYDGVRLTVDNCALVANWVLPYHAVVLHGFKTDPENPDAVVSEAFGVQIFASDGGSATANLGDWILRDEISVMVVTDAQIESDFAHVITVVDPDQMELDLDV